MRIQNLFNLDMIPEKWWMDIWRIFNSCDHTPDGALFLPRRCARIGAI